MNSFPQDYNRWLHTCRLSVFSGRNTPPGVAPRSTSFINTDVGESIVESWLPRQRMLKVAGNGNGSKRESKEASGVFRLEFSVSRRWGPVTKMTCSNKMQIKLISSTGTWEWDRNLAIDRPDRVQRSPIHLVLPQMPWQVQVPEYFGLHKWHFPVLHEELQGLDWMDTWDWLSMQTESAKCNEGKTWM